MFPTGKVVDEIYIICPIPIQLLLSTNIDVAVPPG
jgi:hypothetical protein